MNVLSKDCMGISKNTVGRSVASPVGLLDLHEPPPGTQAIRKP